MASGEPTEDADHDRVAAALQQLRPRPVEDGALWTGLLATLECDEAALATHLLQRYGIVLLGNDAWASQYESLVQRDRFRGVPYALLKLPERSLYVFDDPWSDEAVALLESGHAERAQLVLARPGQVGLRQSDGEAPDSQRQTIELESGDRDTGVAGFVDQAVKSAVREGASDIHFETDRQGISVKYRLDGVMSGGARLDDPARAEEVVSRIKVLAQLDITERRRPQDGRIRWQARGHEEVDLRVSVMPSLFGEDVVLRLLDKAQLHGARERISLSSLGFEGELAEKLRALARRPHGMLLVTGPTGSGKTTTVYAALSEVNDGLEKIVTIEDPVEYELPGVLQIPVNEQKGLTFATGLRSILRHDPDKILVGEIRDSETAEIAVQSALTGHLVFTTVHANSLFDVLGRFQHFQIDPFGLASALNGIVVQRLLRQTCPQCVDWVAPSAHESSLFTDGGVVAPACIPSVRGCPNCRGMGYKGRFVIAEIHELTDDIRDLVVQRAPMTQIRRAVTDDRHQSLLHLALEQVARGRTSLQEVARVVGLP